MSSSVMKVFNIVYGILSGIGFIILLIRGQIALAFIGLIGAAILLFITIAIETILYNTEILLRDKYKSSPQKDTASDYATTVKATASHWICPECGEVNVRTNRICKSCGHEK